MPLKSVQTAYVTISALLRASGGRLLNLRLNDEIEAATFAAKDTELRDRAAQVRLQLEACDRGQSENAELAIKAFELSQRLEEKWLTADYGAKRQILEIICLNLTLVDTTLVPVMRKPFDLLAEGLVSHHHRGDWIRTSDLLVPNQAL
jgi:site-specific DNA recombinase